MTPALAEQVYNCAQLITRKGFTQCKTDMGQTLAQGQPSQSSKDGRRIPQRIELPIVRSEDSQQR